MLYTVNVKIMPLKELLDPQGKAVLGGLNNLSFTQVKDVRIGKFISLTVDTNSEDEAKNIATEAAKKFLSNQVMECFEVELEG